MSLLTFSLPFPRSSLPTPGIFTDLDFADDVALLAEMLSVLVLALEVMNEGTTFGTHHQLGKDQDSNHRRNCTT